MTGGGFGEDWRRGMTGDWWGVRAVPGHAGHGRSTSRWQ